MIVFVYINNYNERDNAEIAFSSYNLNNFLNSDFKQTSSSCKGDSTDRIRYNDGGGRGRDQQAGHNGQVEKALGKTV